MSKKRTYECPTIINLMDRSVSGQQIGSGPHVRDMGQCQGGPDPYGWGCFEGNQVSGTPENPLACSVGTFPTEPSCYSGSDARMELHCNIGGRA